MNQDGDGNRKLFGKVNEGKVDSWSIMKDGNGRLALGEDKV